MQIGAYQSFSTLFILLSLLSCRQNQPEQLDWAHYRGDVGSQQYSPMHQIHADNVAELAIAWTYSSGGADTSNRSQIQCNPLVVGGMLYGTSADLKLFAIDATNGREIWTFDPFDQGFTQFGMGVNRGLAWHEDESSARIFYSAGDRLYVVSPSDGRLITSFGEAGSISLRKGLEHPNIDDLFVVNNTPGIVHKDLIIVGSRVSESVGAAPGHIRAFDVKTGDLRWIFHTIPRPGERGYETWPPDAYQRMGGANAWSGFSLDNENEIVYVPTGSASYDFYGGDRLGDNLFANCIIALNANTGEYIWHYQTVHHDLWDRDLPLAPSLVDLEKEGRLVKALIQPTKSGYLFVLDRLTGEPLYAINEVEVPASDLKGERASPTQPQPSFYPSFSRQFIRTTDLANRTEEAALYAKSILELMHHGHIYTPPSEEGTLIFPGFDGGSEWGGVSFDQKEHTLFINSNEQPWRMVLDQVRPATPGARAYGIYCQSCHGSELQGSSLFGNVPSLKGLGTRMTLQHFSEVVKTGKGVMPAFKTLSPEQIHSLYAFITGNEKAAESLNNTDWPYPYQMRGYEKLYAPDGMPIINPPWGQLTAIQMNTGKIKWQVPLGTEEKLNFSNTGTENYGGPVATAGGLVFIAATKDEKIRAFDKTKGTLLWQHSLPAAGYATPAIYQYQGKAYVVIACGGGKLGTKSGDQYIAFALPDEQ